MTNFPKSCPYFNIIFQPESESVIDILDATSKQDCLTKCRNKLKAKGCEFQKAEGQCAVYYNDVNSADGQTSFDCWILEKCKSDCNTPFRGFRRHDSLPLSNKRK